jgi:hypothetical protein
MRTLRALAMALLIVLALNLVAALTFVGWLRASGRLDAERWERAVAMFELTIAEERQQNEQASIVEQHAQQTAMELARLTAAQDGPVTLAARLVADQQADELAVQRVTRLREDIRALREQVDRARAELIRQREQLDAERAEFERHRQRENELRQDEDFQQAVQLYEQLRPRQTKQMFQVMLDEGRQVDVIDYLAAMQLRAAANVLKEFKDPGEVAQAAVLIQALRARGVEVPSAGQSQAGGGSL